MSPRKNNDDEPPKEAHVDKIHKTIRVSVTGMHMHSMIEDARTRAAYLLDELVEHLYVIDHSPLSVSETARFEPTPRVTELELSVIFGIIPEEERPKPDLRVVPLNDKRRKKS